MNKLILLTPFLLLMLMGIAGATTPSAIPSGIQYYVPINITNSQSTATSAPFQQMINITESTYSSYIAYNGNLANFEIFNGTGVVRSAWIESNSSGVLHVWVKLPNGIPANSKVTLYLGFASKTTNLLSSSGTSGIGEAPQLSPTYAEYDDGAEVFTNYWNFAGTSLPSGWTASGVSYTVNNGVSVGATTEGTKGTLLTTNAIFNASEVLDIYGTQNYDTSYYQGMGALYITSSVNSGTFFFTSGSSSINTQQTTSSGSTTIDNTQVGTAPLTAIYTIQATSTTSNYFVNYGSEQTISADAPTYPLQAGILTAITAQDSITWIRTRSYPPNGVMPSVSFGAVHAVPSLTISPNPSTYGQSVTITSTCDIGDSCAIDYPSLGTAIATGTGSATYTYNAFSLGAGTYSSFYANDITQGTNSTPVTLTINKNSTYNLTLTSCGAQAYPYSCNTTAKITTHNNQVSASLYLNNNLIGSTTTTISNTITNQIGLYSYVFNTTGNTNYTAKSTTANFSSYVPINIYYANATSSFIHKTLTLSGLFLIPQCTNNAASLSLGYCIGNMIYSTSTTLQGNIYVFGNLTIDSGVTITENGHYMYATGTFDNLGAITGGNNPNAPGGAGASGTGSGSPGTSITTSYAGSGAGGGGGYSGGGPGGSGGSTLAPGGSGGAPGATGSSGSTPSAPSMSQSLATSIFNNIAKYLSSASGGGGGGYDNGGGSGAIGVLGVAIGGNKVIAGTINTNGNVGGGGPADGGGGGGSGAGSILIVYNSSYTAGTYSDAGGAGGAGTNTGGGGSGGNGQVITYPTFIYSPFPSLIHYPIKFNASVASNTINFNVSVINLTTHSKLYSQASNQSFSYLPSQPIGYLLNFKEQQGSQKLNLNISFVLNLTDINSTFNFSTPIQYFPILAHTPTWTAKPSSWSIIVANEPITNQQHTNTSLGAQFDSPNLQVSFANAIKLNYPFTSFYLNLTDNPKVQSSLTLSPFKFVASDTTPSAPYTRALLNISNYNERTSGKITANDTIILNNILFNNYTVPANSTSFVANALELYMAAGNYQNPQISFKPSVVGLANSYYDAINNFCPAILNNGQYRTFYIYLADTNASLYTFNIYQGYATGALGDYMQIMQGISNTTSKQVQQFQISAVPFALPLENGGSYAFRFLNSQCSPFYSTNYTVWANPITITLPLNSSVPTINLPNVTVSCKPYPLTENIIKVECTGSDKNNLVSSWHVSVVNTSTFAGYSTVNSVIVNASTFSTTFYNLSNSSVYQVNVKAATPYSSQLFPFTINGAIIPQGFGIGADGFIAILFMLAGLGFGKLGSGEGGFAPGHTISLTLWIEAFIMVMLWLAGPLAFIPLAGLVAVVLMLVVVGAMANHYEGSSYY